jgi:MFS family permease
VEISGAVDNREPANVAGDNRKPFHWRFVTPLFWGSALNPINSSIIATALVGIAADLQVSLASASSLVAGLYLASAVAQPTMGKLSTRFGARRIFVVGMGIVAVGGAVGWIAPTIGWLVVARILIGIGTSSGYPTAMALIRKRADSAKTGIPGSVLGGLSIAGQATAALGLPIGGLLVGFTGWRSVFFINVPLAVIGIIATLVWVPADEPNPAIRRESLIPALDPLGIVLFAGTIGALLGFLSNLERPVWWLIPVIVVLATAGFVWERRAKVPFIDVPMLGRNLPLLRTYLRNFLTLAATYLVLYGLSQWMEEGRGLAPTIVGLVLLPMTGIGATVSAIIARRNWVRGPLIATGASIVAGGAVLVFIGSQSSLVLLIGISLIFGVSTGLGTVGNQAALYEQTPRDEIAVASGLLRTSSYVGAIFSSSVTTLAFGESATDGGLHTVAYVFAAMGIVATVAAVLDRAVPWKAT